MAWYNKSYHYKKPIVIDHTKVTSASNLSNFPMLFSVTDADLATTANGGYVKNSSGFDIIFTDSTETTLLNHEIESYTASTGKLVFWVQIPTLAFNSDTTIYVYFGNPSISTTQEHVNSTWDSNYKGVWHLADNAATTTVKDSTSTANNGTNQANTSTKTTTGKIGVALTFDGSADFVSLGDPAAYQVTTGTISGWLNTSNAGTGFRGIITKQLNYGLFLVDNVLCIYDWGGSSGQVSTGVNLADGAWHYVTLTFQSGVSNGTMIYSDGVLKTTTTYTVSSQTPELDFGSGGGAIQFFGGTLDEMRLSNVVRASSWIGTEYNNQNSPSTFYTVGSRQGVPTQVGIRTRLSVKVTKSFGVRFLERVTAAKSVAVRLVERVQATKSVGVRLLERVQGTKTVGVRLRERVTATRTAPIRFIYQTLSTTKSVGVRFLERVRKTASTPVRFLERVQKSASVPVRLLERVQVTKSAGLRLRERVQATQSVGMRLRYQTIAFTKSAGVRFLERVQKTVSAPLRARIATQKTASAPTRTRIRVTNTTNLPVRFRYQTIPFTKSVGVRLRENVKRTFTTSLRTRITTTVTALVPVRFLLLAGTIAKKYFTVRLRLTVAQSLSVGMRFLYRTIFDMLKVKAWDTFHRANQSGWGTASDGVDIWAFAGAAYTASIVSNEGQLTGTTGIGVGILGTNTIDDGTVLVGVNAVDSTSDEVGAVLRYTDINNFYFGKATGGNKLYLAQRVTGTVTNLTFSTISQTTNTSYWLRFYVAGNKLKARWWSKDIAEPGSWTVVTSSSLTGAHQYGVFYNAAATTNHVLFDNFEVDFSTRVMAAPVRLVLQVAASVATPIRTLLSVGKTLTTPLRTRLRVTTTRSAPVRLRYQTIAFTRYVGVRFLERVQRSAVAPVRTRLTTLVTKSIATRFLLRVGRTFSAPVRARLQVRATASSPIRGRVRVLNTVIVPIRFIYQNVSTTKSFGVRLRERVTATVVAPIRARIRQFASRTAPLRTRLSVGQSKSTQMRTVLRAQNTRVAQVRGRLSIRATVSLPIRFIYQTVHTTLWSPVRVRLRAQRTGTTALRLHLIFSQVRALGIRSKISVQRTPVAPMRFVLYVPPTNAIFRVRKGLMYLKVREP